MFILSTTIHSFFCKRTVRNMNYMCLFMVVVFFSFIRLAHSTEKVLPELDVTMGLDLSLEEVLKINPVLASQNKTTSEKEGIMSIQGPLKFHFSFGKGRQLDFEQVKAVIYPMFNYKVDYIHVFPQKNHVQKNEMYTVISNIEKQIVSKGWKLYIDVADDGYDDELISLGKKDYAYYRYEADKSIKGSKKLELVLTAFRDLTVLCSSKSKTKKQEANCPNRFIRVGLYSVK